MSAIPKDLIAITQPLRRVARRRRLLHSPTGLLQLLIVALTLGLAGAAGEGGQPALGRAIEESAVVGAGFAAGAVLLGGADDGDADAHAARAARAGVSGAADTGEFAAGDGDTRPHHHGRGRTIARRGD